jgi:hypothetical protein
MYFAAAGLSLVALPVYYLAGQVTKNPDRCLEGESQEVYSMKGVQPVDMFAWSNYWSHNMEKLALIKFKHHVFKHFRGFAPLFC